MENKEILVKEDLNGCFGNLYRGGDLEKRTAYLKCECNTSNVSSDPNEEHCNFCPFMGKKIKLVNYPVQVAGFGFSGSEDLGSRLREEL
jgi:hypothetical protein